MKFKKNHSDDPKIKIKLKIENIIKTELKKLAQYWKNNIFKKFFEKFFFIKLFFSKKKFFLNQNLETENLYNINKELTSNKNKNVYKLFE